MNPTAHGKRGRPIRIIETGKIVSHEEVVRGLVKKTAALVANGGLCRDCGVGLVRPKKGRTPTRCKVCEVEENRRHARDHGRKHGLKTAQRGRYSKPLAAAVAGMARRAAHNRNRQKKVREERKAAGLCLFCGKAPGYHGTARCEVCRAKRMGRKAGA